MFIKTEYEIKKKLPPKYTPQKIIFFNEGAHPTPKCAFTPNSKEAQKKFLGCLASILQFVTSCYSKSPMEFHQLKFVPY
jgi:hypothetical protein